MNKLLCISFLLLMESMACNAGESLKAWWSFDDGTGRDGVSGRIDQIGGHHGIVSGVRGKALKSDEFGTFICRDAGQAPLLDTDEFTVEAWIAPQTFPWNYCPIVTQRNGNHTFYFGINYQGQLQLHAMVNGEWTLCESRPALPGLNETFKFAGEGGNEDNWIDYGDLRPDPSVPLLKWTHVAGTRDHDGNLRLFINGEPAEQMLTVSDHPDMPVTLEKDPVIDIRHAFYGRLGYPGQYTVVTEKIQDQFAKGNLVLKAGSDLVEDDPAPGKAKHLQVIWGIDGRYQVEIVAEGMDADLGVLKTKLLNEAGYMKYPAFPTVSGITIGRTTKPVLPLYRARFYGNEGTFCSWDGLLDEIKLYDKALGADDVRNFYESVQPENLQPLEFRRMPTAQDLPGPFGAFYTRFDYDEDWDRTRRMGPAQDLFVRFENNPCTFVVWNGTVYPIWYPDGGEIGQMFEAYESWSKDGCHEAMMDHRNEYSSWKILENSPARVVILWRHALLSRAGTLANVDPKTGWSDWVDDYYTIYPDAVCARRTVLWSSVPLSRHSYAQDNSVLQPAVMPWDVYEREPLSLANIDGQETIQTMGKGHHGAKDTTFMEPAVIQKHNFASRWKPFMIAPPNEVFSGEWTNDASWPWNLPCWHHWPTAQLIDSDGSCTFVNNGRPKSSCLTNGWGYGRIQRDAVDFTENMLIRYSLVGMTDGSAGALAPLARSYRQPPEASTSSEGFRSEGFLLGEKAFHFIRMDSNETNDLLIEVAARNDAPLVNPAFVVKNWGKAAPVIELDGKKLGDGNDFEAGFHQTPTETNLIVWIKRSISDPVELVISSRF